MIHLLHVFCSRQKELLELSFSFLPNFFAGLLDREPFGDQLFYFFKDLIVIHQEVMTKIKKIMFVFFNFNVQISENRVQICENDPFVSNLSILKLLVKVGCQISFIIMIQIHCNTPTFSHFS